MNTRKFLSQSSAETVGIGRQIAPLLAPPRFLILRGELGAGKTTLVKGIADALEAADPDEVTSPTFTLIHEYEGTLRAEDRARPVELYHLDLYRIEDERELETLGIHELASADAIVLVEWGEKFLSVVKRSGGEILIEHAGGDARTITLKLED